MTNTLGLNLGLGLGLGLGVGLNSVVWMKVRFRIASSFVKVVVPRTFPNTSNSNFPRKYFSHKFLSNSANYEKTISSFSNFEFSLVVAGPVFHGHDESNRSVQKAQRCCEQRSSSGGGQLRRCRDRNGEYFAFSLESVFV